MEISGSLQIFLFGCLGGSLIELLRWWKLRESLEFPNYCKKPAYWCLTLAMITAGGLIAVAYGTGTTKAILAMNLGASTPAIIGTLATQPKASGSERSFSGSAPMRSKVRTFLGFGH